MIPYLKGKLFEINYRMAVHEGDAKHRLASESIKILLIPLTEVPAQYRKEFSKLRTLAEKTIRSSQTPSFTSSGIRDIQNRTAVKYIKLLINIEDYVRNELNSI